MSFRREFFWTAFAVLTAGWCVDAFAQPVFEGRTPRGFSPSDSTTTTRFVADEDVTILVDLNEAATQTYPVIANFQTLEKSVPFYSGSFQDSTTRYMSQAIAVDDFGFIHRAWIQQRGEVSSTSTTPVYGVVYAKSVNGGKSFLDTVSVSGTLRFDLITASGTDATAAPVTGFSTVDIVVDSKGNPRVSYAMDFSPDGFNEKQLAIATIGPQIIRTGARAYNNIFFNFSNDGGSSWLPANGAVVINDSATVTARNTAFPRMAITRTDDIFIVYERDIAGVVEDVMLAKVDADSLTGGSAQAVIVGSVGQTASRGGVRIDPDGDKGFSPDIAIGDDDVLHIVWYNSTDNTVLHKTNQAKLWSDVTPSGWDNIVDGATVGTFEDDTNIGGLGLTTGLVRGTSDRNSIGPANGEVHLFPTVVVDKQASPDRIYVLWKTSAANSAAATALNHENIAYNNYDYDGQTGAPVSAWLSSEVNAFPTGTGADDENSMFQNNTAYQIEQHWTFVDRVAAVVDDRLSNRGDLHIVFSGGPSTKGNLTFLAAGATSYASATSLYYSRFNGVEWELPQVVASARHNDTQHDAGVLLKHAELFEPDIAVRSGDDNVYLTFVGGSQTGTSTDVKGAGVISGSGRGHGAVSSSAIAARPYFKVIGRVTSFDDTSVPVGGFQYQLVYNPVNPPSGTSGTLTSENLIVVTAADNANGSGIGAATPSSSKAPGGFLTGQWTNAGLSSLGVTSLDPANSPATFVAKGAGNNVEASNDNGVFQGQTDDDASLGYAEWGDAGDKNGLLVKLNVLGSDSANNLFVIRASTPAVTSTAGATSQSVSLTGRTRANLGKFVKGKRVQLNNATAIPTTTTLFADGTSSGVAPRGGVGAQNDVGLGSYFQMGANITIIAANTAPVVTVVDPNASTTGFTNESFNIRYIIFDDDDDLGSTSGATATDSLQMELYFYPDNGLSSVQDIRVFATLIVDENDAFTAATPAGTGDFRESTSASNNQTYTWDDPGSALQTGRGFAAITKTLDGDLFIYAVADDGVNQPVFDVSDGSLKIKHISDRQIRLPGLDRHGGYG